MKSLRVADANKERVYIGYSQSGINFKNPAAETQHQYAVIVFYPD